MTPEERQQLEAISDALARIVRHQREIDDRLARLESLQERAAPEPVRAEAPPPVPVLTPTSPQPAPPRVEAEASREPRQIEAAFGLTWISRIGMITVVLALAFFFEYAFENRWITAWGRVALGLALGAVAGAFGERFWRHGERVFAQALTAAAIAFSYLSFWASFALYNLVGRPAAFGLMLLTTAAAGGLAVRYNGAAIAALGLAGGYATPLLLGSERDPWFVLAYVLLLDLGAAAAARARRWPWLEALAITGTAVVYLTQLTTPATAGPRTAYTLFVCLYYLLFAASDLQGAAVAVQLLAALALVPVWAPSAGILMGALAIAAAGLAVADWRGWPGQVTASFAGFWAAYLSWRLQDGAVEPLGWLLPVLSASFLLYLGWPVWRAARRQPLRLQELAVVAMNAALYFGTCYGLLETRYAGYEGLFAIAVAAVVMGTARWLWDNDARGALLAAGIAWVLLVLAVPIQFAGYRVTVAWALESAAVCWIGVRAGDLRTLYASAAVFLLVLVRLAAVDSAMYSNPGTYVEFFNARFLTFAVAAASFWAAAWWTRRGSYAFGTYVAGHAVLLWALCLEAVGWAGRTAAPADARSVASTTISVILAAYAVMLVAAGIFRQDALTRILGAGLIGFVVLKLYLYDVWLLGQFYRMAAFAILGVLLLVMSYFYSRLRGSVENWWRT